MAGPETGLTPNVDEIVQSGLADAGLGASTATTTTGPAPSVPVPGDPAGGKLNFSVQQPEWAAPPSQADMGQVDVRRGNYDTGLVTTPQFQFPFAALANRQMANQQRKAKLEKDLADFNLYGGIGKAHDRYQSAFGKWGPAQIDARVAELSQAFGGNKNEAIKFLRTTDEGRAMLARWSKEVESIGQENKGWTDDTIETLARVRTGEQYIPPERLRPLLEYASSVGADGMPVQGVSSGDFLPKMRNVEGQLREIQYIDKVIQPAMANALMTTIGVDISKKRVGGKIQLTSEEKKTYDRAIDYFVDQNEDFVDLYHDGDKAAAKKALESFFPTSIKETVALESPYSAPSSGASSSDGKSWSGAPAEEIVAMDPGGTQVTGEGVATRAMRMPFGQIVGGRNENMGPRKFMNSEGDPVEIRPEAIVYFPDKGQYFVEGRSTREQTVETESTGTRRDKTVVSERTAPLIRVPLTGSNVAAMRQYLPDFNWESAFGASKKTGKPPAGLDQAVWDAMTPEEKALF